MKKGKVLVIMLFAVFVLNILTHVFGETFSNPITTMGSADPHITYAGGYYYGLCTDGSDSIRIWKARRVQDLYQGSYTTVLSKTPNTDYDKNIYAPDMYYLDGKWYIYAVGKSNAKGERVIVLEGGTNPDNPLESPFSYKATVNTNSRAIDGSIIEINNTRYFIFTPLSGGTNKIAIAKMINLWTIESNQPVISSASLSWENDGSVNEAPYPLYKNGRIMIVYSANWGSRQDYCLGLLTYTGNNPLDPASWVKNSMPIFAKTSKVFGPGTFCSFKSPDGTEDWFAYHAKTSTSDTWSDRYVRVQKFTWNADNTPNLGTPSDPGAPIEEPSGQSSSGLLNVSSAASSGDYNLTILGTRDWAHWGKDTVSDFNHKDGVLQMISNWTKIGTGTVTRAYANQIPTFSWTDGTPSVVSSNNRGFVRIGGIGNGFQISAPADTVHKILKLYVGVQYNDTCKLEVSLSDSSAPPVVKTNTGYTVYTIDFKSASIGQLLTVKYTVINGTGNAVLQAATLQ